MWREVGRWGVEGGREMECGGSYGDGMWGDIGIWSVEGGRDMGCGGR